MLLFVYIIKNTLQFNNIFREVVSDVFRIRHYTCTQEDVSE